MNPLPGFTPLEPDVSDIEWKQARVSTANYLFCYCLKEL